MFWKTDDELARLADKYMRQLERKRRIERNKGRYGRKYRL